MDHWGIYNKLEILLHRYDTCMFTCAMQRRGMPLQEYIKAFRPHHQLQGVISLARFHPRCFDVASKS